MPFDVAAALKAGRSPTEVANYLGQQNNFDSAAAMKAGFSADEIIGHLNRSGSGVGRGTGSSGFPAIDFSLGEVPVSALDFSSGGVAIASAKSADRANPFDPSTAKLVGFDPSTAVPVDAASHGLTPYNGDFMPIANSAGAGRGSVNPSKGANEFSSGNASRGTAKGIIASAQSRAQDDSAYDTTGTIPQDVVNAQSPAYVGDAGRGGSDDPRRLDNVYAGDALSRGLQSSAAAVGKTVMLGVAAPAVLAENGWNAVTGRDDHPVSNAIFSQAVDPFVAAQKANEMPADANTSVLAKTAYSIGSMVPDIALVLATGGSSAVEQAGVSLAPEAMNAAQIVGKAIMHGADAMRPVIIKNAANAAQQVLENGGDRSQAFEAGLHEGAKTALMGALPLSASGNAATRAATGFGVGALQSEAERGLHNLANPEQQQPFDLGNTVAAGASQAVLAGAMGHPADSFTAPDRAALGYEDAQAKIAAAPDVDTAIAATQASLSNIDPSVIAANANASTALSANRIAELQRMRAISNKLKMRAATDKLSELNAIKSGTPESMDEAGNPVPAVAARDLNPNEQARYAEAQKVLGIESQPDATTAERVDNLTPEAGMQPNADAMQMHDEAEPVTQHLVHEIRSELDPAYKAKTNPQETQNNPVGFDKQNELQGSADKKGAADKTASGVGELAVKGRLDNGDVNRSSKAAGDQPSSESEGWSAASLNENRGMVASDLRGEVEGERPIAPTAEDAVRHIDEATDLDTLQKTQAKAALRKGDINPEDVVPKQKIEDLGQKLHGARKDYATTLKDAEALDVSAEPLSKSWPEPDYDKLMKQGATPYAVAFAHAVRDQIPAKPKQSWKLKRYMEQVKNLRDMASRALSGELSQEKLEAMLSRPEFSDLRRVMGGATELYQRLGHQKSLKGIEISRGEYSLYGGVKYEPPKVLWTVGQKNSPFHKDTVSGETREEALDKFAARHMAIGSEPAKKATEFIVFRKDGKYSVGKKIGKDYVSLKSFDDLPAARKYRAENQAELESALERYRSVPFERNAENQPRVGDDHRNGASVTPEAFTDAFGFRGVQFGNYVEDTRRQHDLNNAYDGLHDLAAVIGVPTRALSLDGQLGLAFGARGKGGKNAASAHFEPDQTVINLTKNSGAGSLAHEWFHSLDSYFAKIDGGKGGFVTEGASNPNMRPEMAQAFKNLMTTIKATGMRNRSKELDKRRSTPYWSADSEMAARAFESYIITKLHDQSAANDYLANVVGEDYWKARDALFGHSDEESYPYPKESEMAHIRPAFDKFFNTIETEQRDNGNVVLRDIERPKSPFYSALSRSFDSIKSTAAPAAGWKDAIKGLINKGQVKADEVEWSGVNEWLDMQQGRVTKEQVQDFLKRNGVQVHEVTFHNDEHEFGERRPVKGGTNYRELLLTLPSVEDGGYFHDHYPDHKNVLAHIRLDDHTDTDGNRVLMVNEVQSDWAQQGRKAGFDVVLPRRIVEKSDGKWVARQTDESFPGFDRFKTKVAAEKFADQLVEDKATGIKSAPFVTKTDAWVALAMKRILKVAADEGYQKVALPSGGDVAKQFHLTGKSGDGLEAFYDKIVPTVSKDVALKLGGKVSEVALPTKRNVTTVTIERERAGQLAGYAIKDHDSGEYWNESDGAGKWSDTPSISRGISESSAALRRADTNGEPLRLKGIDIAPAMRDKVADGVPLFDRSMDVQRPFNAGYRKSEVPRLRAANSLKKVVDQHAEGKLTDAELALKVRLLAGRMEEISDAKQSNRDMAERQRGADLVREKLLMAKRRGDIPEDSAEFADWLLRRNPDLANGLGISISSNGKSAGQYNPASEVMTIFKGRANEGTAVHEVLHHTERMMPTVIQDGIRKEWARFYADTMKDATPEQRKALLAMAESIAGDAEASRRVNDAFKDGTLDYDQHYQLVNPSEFWAVNATRILSKRFEAGTWQSKAKQWMSEMIQKIKNILGLQSDHPILQGLKAVMSGNGEKLSRRMLSDLMGFRDPGESRDEVKESNAADALDKTNDLHAYPKSREMTIDGIVKDNSIDGEIKVRTTRMPDETVFTLTFPDDSVVKIHDRKASPYGQDKQLYAYDTDRDNNRTNEMLGRPGENPEDVPSTDDVFIDASQQEPGKNGAVAYNIAQTYAHNNGKIFIGDPSGLSDVALRRRTEQMLNSALKFGTTAHLAPHPRQVAGSSELGVPPLKWVYGDHVANTERLIDVAMKSLENNYHHVQHIPTFRPDTADFRGADGNGVRRQDIVKHAAAQVAGTSQGTGAETEPTGWRTAARYSIFKSLLGEGKRAEGSGLLDRLREHEAGIENRGTEGGTYPPTERVFYDIGHRPDDSARKSESKLPGADLLSHATTRMSQFIDNHLDELGVYERIAPMSSGTQRTRAMAQRWINANRRAQYEWQTIDHHITENFTPKQREAMWNAADEENDIRRAGDVSDGTGRGLDSLSPEERAVVNQLHEYGEEIWQRAKETGMVKSAGVNFWTPRMMVRMGEDGDFSDPSRDGVSESDLGARGLTTKSGSAMTRNYDTAAETEAAMKAKGGELVRDIRTMPLAMGKLEKAVAGHELINQIKDLGYSTGRDLVSEHAQEGFFTLDHPSFKTFKPRLEENDGKWRVMTDQDGNPVMDKQPIYISNEFRGPLKAILSNPNSTPYNAYMLLKSKAMNAIMYSPLIHNQVIAGRAFAYAGLKLPKLYFTGYAVKQDHEFMKQVIGHGMVPIGRRSSMLDVGDIARGVGKEGSWGDPEQSWIALGAQKIGNGLHEGIGDKLKTGIDAAGDLWHNTLLWDRVGDLQAGIAKDVYTKLLAKGTDENTALTVAAHISNRYAGAIGRENMSDAMHKFLNVMLFSKSFNMGNIGSIKDSLYGLPAGLKAQLFEGSSGESALMGLSKAKSIAFTGQIMDFAAMILVTSLVQDWVKRDKSKGWKDELTEGLSGYSKRMAHMWANASENPLELNSYNPYRLSSTWGNEPSKQNRVDLGKQPNSPRHEYMRLPTGKVIEDLAGWVFNPIDTLEKKLSPVASAVHGLATNNKDSFGTPIYDPSDSVVHKAMDMALYFAGKNFPLDQLETAKDIAQGHGTQLDKDKLEGSFTGLTISQGHPHGPEGALAAEVEKRLEVSKKYVMAAVKSDLKYGREERAYNRLIDIGLSPREANHLIRNIDSPRDGLSATQRRKFNQHSNDADRAAMDSVE